MKLLISGHRKSKLTNYSESAIVGCIFDCVANEVENNYVIGLSGMADGVDLWFCEILQSFKINYYACIPFEEQNEYMSECDAYLRDNLIKAAMKVYKIRNSEMINMADKGIIVWDGNKGGTHNVLQQMIENKKPFYWINPVRMKTVYMD